MLPRWLPLGCAAGLLAAWACGVAWAGPPAGRHHGFASRDSGAPIGWRLYRDINSELPHLTRGVRTQAFSSFDRTGGNRDFRHCQKAVAGGGCVLAEHDGPGEVVAIWTTSKNGNVSQSGNIHVVLDGKMVLDAPEQAVVDGKLGAPFVYLLVANAEKSSGGAYIMVPMAFRHSMKIWTDHDPIYYHVWYKSFASVAGVATFHPADAARAVIDSLEKAGTRDPKAALPQAMTRTARFTLAPGKSATLAVLQGPGEIGALEIKIPQLAGPGSDRQRTLASTDILQNARLRISFDGQQTVDAPLGQFFGSGLGLYPVKAIMFAMEPPTRTMTAWWPMPYRRGAVVTLYNGSRETITTAQARFTFNHDPRWTEDLGPAGSAGYFHATSNDQQTVPGKDYLFLKTTGWGKFVGVSETMRGPDGRGYLEGDIHIYVDGSRTPQINGTGTEDFYQGGWYFNHGTFTDPFNGEPAHLSKLPGGRQDCTAAYRLNLVDAVPFHSSIRVGIEHGPTNDVAAHYSSTAYWYGRAQVSQGTSAR